MDYANELVMTFDVEKYYKIFGGDFEKSTVLLNDIYIDDEESPS